MTDKSSAVYVVPEWSGNPSENNFFTIEILKEGKIINEIFQINP